MEFTVYDVAMIPLIVALVEVLKNIVSVPAKWVPLITLILGQAAAFIYVAPGDPKYAVLAGLIMALSAMGMWSGTKNVIRKPE